MSLSRFLKGAGVGIAVAVLVLVVGVAGNVAWAVWRAQTRSTDGLVVRRYQHGTVLHLGSRWGGSRLLVGVPA
jgi:hypothetical protein